MQAKTLSQIEAGRKEADAWRNMFKELSTITQIPRDTLNEAKYTPLFAEIEKWAYFEHMRRLAFQDNQPRGNFWEGDD